MRDAVDWRYVIRVIGFSFHENEVKSFGAFVEDSSRALHHH